MSRCGSVNINLVFVSGISGLGSIQSTVDQYNYVSLSCAVTALPT